MNEQDSFLIKLLPLTDENISSFQNDLLLLKWIIQENKSEEIIKKSIEVISRIIHASISVFTIYKLPDNKKFTEYRFNEEKDSVITSQLNQKILKNIKKLSKPSILWYDKEDISISNKINFNGYNHIPILIFPLNRNGQINGFIYFVVKKFKQHTKDKVLKYLNSFFENIKPLIFEIYFNTNKNNLVLQREKELREKYEFDIILGKHPRIIEVLKLISLVARTDATVLIQGESGTGKELVARALHLNSIRKSKPFIPINCGALSENLLESELFGHVKGAFTGAFKDKLGWFETADGGTIFLDEISKMSPSLQVELLRILQTGEYSPLGSPVIKHCDVRIIAASDDDLKEMVAKGKFREEVYYRLNVVDIDIPPLRERRSDIIPLAKHFFNDFKQKYNKDHLSITDNTLYLLENYDFPGNVRELENAIERAVVLADEPVVDINHLPASIRCKQLVNGDVHAESSFKIAKQKVIDNFENEYIAECLRVSKGNISKAANNAGINIKNFYMKMKKYAINPISFK